MDQKSDPAPVFAALVRVFGAGIGAVVVYSTGDVAHEFVLGFATEWDALFTVSLGAGTAYVLDPVDDVTFTHKAAFAKGTNGKWRKAYVFRWLQAEKNFYADTGGMVVP